MKTILKYSIAAAALLAAGCADNNTALDYPNVEIDWSNSSQGYPTYNFGDLDTPPVVLLPIASGKADYGGSETIPPEYQNGMFYRRSTGNEGPIANAWDGTDQTWFHTPYGDFNSANMYPIILEFTLEGSPEAVDYVNLVPRNPGGNGEIREVELFVQCEGGDWVSYGKKEVASGPVNYMFRPSLADPRKVKAVVTKSSGEFVSLGEIECGLRQSPYTGDMMYFADELCTSLKAGVSRPELEAIETPWFRNMALAMFDGTYDNSHRLFDVKTYPMPNIIAEENKTAPYGILDNATGIYVDWNDNIVIFVEDNMTTDMTLRVVNPMKGFDPVQIEPLMPGVNVFTAKEKGLLYFIYQDEAEVTTKVHVASGKINGLFDVEKNSPSDWKTLLDRASFSHMDVLGKYSHLIMTTVDLKAYVNDGKRLCDAYDTIVEMEQDFSGFGDYTTPDGKSRWNKTRICMMAVNTDAFMYAANYYTGYTIKALADLLEVDKLLTTGIWGPAHEIGHVNQTRPGFKWGGYEVEGDMTEVTNNVHALYVQTELSNESRMITEGHYPSAFNRFFVSEEPYAAGKGSEFCFEKLTPLWQLYLYFGRAMGDEDIYKRLLEAIRLDETYENYKTANSAQVLYCKNRFAVHASRATGCDLTQFFGDYQFRLDAKTKSEIAAMELPGPDHLFRYINDLNVDLYKYDAQLIPGSVSVTNIDGEFHIYVDTDCKNAVAFEVYIPSDPDKPVMITYERSFTTMTASSRVIVKAVGADGTRAELTQK